MKLKLIIPALAIALGLAITGCKEGRDHDHDHDHAHEHGDGDKDGGSHEKEDGDKGHQKTTAASTDTQVAAKPTDGAKPYPLDVCLVADKKLGSMGDPYVFVHEGQEIKFCCEGCMPSFEKDPKKFLAKLTPVEKPAEEKK